MKGIILPVAIAAVACSSASSSAPPSTKANPCATPGATYLLHFVEQANGTCGPVSDQIINVAKDGTLSGSGTASSCAMTAQDGCTARNTDCMSTTNGVTCDVTSDVTFAKDGGAASGLETVTCMSGSSSCMSTYAVSAQRK